MNYRLRTWHSNIIEYSEGRPLCSASSPQEAHMILDALRGNKAPAAVFTVEHARALKDVLGDAIDSFCARAHSLTRDEAKAEEADLEMPVSLINEVGMYGEAAALRGRMPEL